MAISLKEFNNLMQSCIIDILWKHWASLGVATHIPEETKYPIDLEALIVATIYTGNLDKRLFSSSIEWVINNKKWVNLSRVKGIERHFNVRFNHDEVRISPGSLVSDLVKNKDLKKVKNKYKNLLEDFKIRGVVSEPAIKKPVLIQLLLRGIFGVNARAETLLYMLSGGRGSSLSISREIFYDQKVVYRILENWRKTGMVEKIKGMDYYLPHPEDWLKLLQINNLPEYINWSRFFSICIELLHKLSIKPWADNKYMISSFFRDIAEELKPLSKTLGVRLPPPELFKGEEFFSPFAETLLEICQKI